jgi:hypothetical protein
MDVSAPVALFSTCQGHAIDVHLVALCFAACQKQRRGGAGEGGFKGKADFGCCQRAQALRHNATRLKRHDFGGLGGRTCRNLVCVDELQNTQGMFEQLWCRCRFARAIEPGNHHHGGLLGPRLWLCGAGGHGYLPQLSFNPTAKLNTGFSAR